MHTSAKGCSSAAATAPMVWHMDAGCITTLWMCLGDAVTQDPAQRVLAGSRFITHGAIWHPTPHEVG